MLHLARKCQIGRGADRISDVDVLRFETAKTATGMAKASEIELQRSITG